MKGKFSVVIPILLLSLDDPVLADPKGHWCNTAYDGRVFTTRDCSYYDASPDHREQPEPVRDDSRSRRQPDKPPVVDAQYHSSESGIVITRVYRSSDNYVRVVIATDRKRRVRCYLTDRNDKPIAADYQYMNPPVDEMLIRASGVIVGSAVCREE